MAREGDDLVILDQHGAHERILYERHLENPRAGAVALQSRVVALLPEGLAPEAWKFEVGLGALGVRFEHFEEGAVRISAVPETITDPEAALLAALYALAGGEDLAKALACKRSTKVGEGLSEEETKALLREWASCEFRGVWPRWRAIAKRQGTSGSALGIGRH